MEREIKLTSFLPKTRLEVKETLIEKPKFPFIDGHSHLQLLGKKWFENPIEKMLEMMDFYGLKAVVDLDGLKNDEVLQSNIHHYKENAPDRFYHMAGIEWAQWPVKGNSFGEWAAESVEKKIKIGASGIKIWKNLGLHIKDEKQELVKVDDYRLDPIFEKAAQLQIPVYMHIADPVAFFDPVDEYNERWEELSLRPDRSFHGKQFPSFQKIINQFANLIRRHKNTIFVGCHVAGYAENLSWVSSLLDECPNLFIDISGRIGELGRQPYTSRRFFLKQQDRIIFGTDRMPEIEWYKIYARFLETDDEYFNYFTTYPPRQGRWFIYGLNLPDSVLKKVYTENVLKIFKK
ncbi:MAG: amidohydrolase family protein [Atribacterota bacterium]|nr:amidohydrolase family protein [Atribacterota bacterium]